jgi:hypothetical protein
VASVRWIWQKEKKKQNKKQKNKLLDGITGPTRILTTNMQDVAPWAWRSLSSPLSYPKNTAHHVGKKA